MTATRTHTDYMFDQAERHLADGYPGYALVTLKLALRDLVTNDGLLTREQTLRLSTLLMSIA